MLKFHIRMVASLAAVTRRRSFLSKESAVTCVRRGMGQMEVALPCGSVAAAAQGRKGFKSHAGSPHAPRLQPVGAKTALAFHVRVPMLAGCERAHAPRPTRLVPLHALAASL